MPRFQVSKSHLHKLLILVLALACFGGIFSLMGLWESHRQQQATLQQQQVDEAARRRREG